MEYEQNRDRLKLCALCWNRIEKEWVVCKDHIEDMEKYRNEQWFQELVRMQERQHQIEIEEYRLMLGGIYTRRIITKLTDKNKNEIIRLYKNGLGCRRISRVLSLPLSAVNKFLYRYRKTLKEIK